MNASSLDRLAGHFERLRDLPAEQRSSALDVLALEPDEHGQLERMLAADALDDDPLLRAIGDAAASLHAPRGARIGAWQLLREIGAGGMGTVFLAQRVDGNFSQRVAIKLLRGFPTSDGMRRLRQERQILAGLDHPHIARLLDGGETDEGQPWLAIEHVDGIGLLDFIAAHASTRAQRLALFDDMLAAVEHAHQRLVIHRDIKPANVLVTGNGVVKLLDFGIARLISLDGDGQRETSTRIFSRGYASPEQCAGGAITTVSDIYSLGILLHEMLEGRQDSGGGQHAALAAVAIDVELAGIIAKASADAPADRYRSVGDFRDDLARYRAGRPVRAAPLTRRYRLHKFIGRHRFGSAAVVLVALMLAAFVWRLDRERGRALTAEASAQRSLLASQRDAASARASLEFLGDAFAAAAPDRAMSRQVSVRDLLDVARAKLDQRSAGEDELLRTMQRMLARLYSQLGEAAIAVDLMRRGLESVEPASGAEALRLADEYAEYASLLGLTGDPKAALAAVAQVARWREQFAPGDALARINSLQTRAVAQHRDGNDELAIADLREAAELATSAGVNDADTEIETTQLLASLLAANGDCEGALQAAEQGMRRADVALEADSPTRLVPMRSKASALNACGRPAEAESLLRAAIELQDRTVASGGARMMNLTNDLAVILNDLGRYQEAVEMLDRSSQAMRAAGLHGIEEAVAWVNEGGIHENAGDYTRALEAFTHARVALDQSGVDADHQVRRRAERSEARTLGIVGQHAEALRRLTDLRLRCARIEGGDSGEYAMLTWQLAILARRMQRADVGLPLLAEAELRWAALVPASHPLFAHARRLRAAFARQKGDLELARHEMLAAITALEETHSLPVDLAIARSELADIHMRAGERAQARELLQLAMPVLRGAVLRNEVGRVLAEQTADLLGGLP